MARTAITMAASKPGTRRMAPAPKEPDNTTYSGRLAARIRFLRKEAGFTVDELAERMAKRGYPVSVPTIYHWEVGRSAPHVDSLPALAKALKVDIRELFPEK